MQYLMQVSIAYDTFSLSRILSVNFCPSHRPIIGVIRSPHRKRICHCFFDSPCYAPTYGATN